MMLYNMVDCYCYCYDVGMYVWCRSLKYSMAPFSFVRKKRRLVHPAASIFGVKIRSDLARFCGVEETK
jgi:hypothetical protein